MFWLLSSIDENSAYWLYGNMSLLKSDQQALVTVSAIDFSGMILSRPRAQLTNYSEAGWTDSSWTQHLYIFDSWQCCSIYFETVHNELTCLLVYKTSARVESFFGCCEQHI